MCTIPPEAEPYVDHLYALGFSADEALATLRALIYGECSGISTHGLRRIYGGFIGRAVQEGLFEPGVEPVALGPRNGILCFDARGAIGYYAFDKILSQAMSGRGSFMLHIANLYPTNALAQQAEMLCDAGYVCFIASRSPARVIGPAGDRPVLSAEPVIGTNAQAWGYPGSDGHHMVFDSSFASANNGDLLSRSPAADSPVDPSAFLTSTFARARTWGDVIRDGRFTGLVRPFGGAKDHLGFGMLLVPEMLHWLGEASAPGSTFVMALRPQDDQGFAAARDAFEARFSGSLRFAGGGKPRLPHATARARRLRTSPSEALARAAIHVPALPAWTKSLVRVRLAAAAPFAAAPSGRTMPLGGPAADLLASLARRGGRLRIPAVPPPRSAPDLLAADAAFADGEAALRRLDWAAGAGLAGHLIADLVAVAPGARWAIEAGHGCPEGLIPALVLTRDPGAAGELARRFPRSLLGLLAPGPGPAGTGCADGTPFDLTATRDDADSLTLVAAGPPPADPRPASRLAAEPRGADARRLARIRQVAEAVAATVGTGVTADELVALATGRGRPGPAFFDAWATEGYALPALRQHSALLDACLEKVPFSADDNVLDLGCGDGRLAALLPEIARLDLLDPSQAMLDRIPVDKLAARQWRRICGDFLNLPPARYDRILAVMSLHHFNHGEIASVLEACRSRLTPGGLIYIGETFIETTQLDRPEVIDRICDVYLRKIVNAARQNCLEHAIKDMEIMGRVLRGDGEHMRTRRQWRHLLRDAGLRVIAESTTSPEIMYGYLLAAP